MTDDILAAFIKFIIIQEIYFRNIQSQYVNDC